MDELFEIYDSHGNPRGLAARPRVHALGLWHRSAHVFLFDSGGRLCIQLRARDKDLYPGLWDYSVGEHLQPGETFAAAAERGLAEELGVRGVTLEAVGGVRRSSFAIASRGIHDRELQQAYRGVCDAPLQPDPAEVAAVRRIPMPELQIWIERSPSDFTPWFKSGFKQGFKHGFKRDLVDLGL